MQAAPSDGNKKPLETPKFDPDILEIPCVVLGFGHIEGAKADDAMLKEHYAKGWHMDPNKKYDYPRKLDDASKVLEAGGAELRVASLKADEVKPIDPSGAGRQDGGNGSGGDGNVGTYNADMIVSRLGFTFWKRDTGGAQTDLATTSNASIAEIYAANFDPGFAKMFPSHRAAMAFLATKDGVALRALFKYLLVVACNAKLSDFQVKSKDNVC